MAEGKVAAAAMQVSRTTQNAAKGDANTNLVQEGLLSPSQELAAHEFTAKESISQIRAKANPPGCRAQSKEITDSPTRIGNGQCADSSDVTQLDAPLANDSMSTVRESSKTEEPVKTSHAHASHGTASERTANRQACEEHGFIARTNTGRRPSISERSVGPSVAKTIGR